MTEFSLDLLLKAIKLARSTYTREIILIVGFI
ncbi:degenerate transposase (orf2) [Streptococcus pneumoniae]|nr:degenerate transposase (orf2) [Streptococcus pneumoniae]